MQKKDKIKKEKIDFYQVVLDNIPIKIKDGIPSLPIIILEYANNK